jgi:transposase
MNRYKEPKINTDQISLVPIDYENKVHEASIARIIDMFVNSLNLLALGFKHAETNALGQRPYDPKDLLKLLLYGYYEGVRSSRKLHKECWKTIDVMWMINELKPSFRVIGDFRKDNIEALPKVFVAFSELLVSLNLYGKDIIAVDGSKFRANNSKKRNYSGRKIDAQIKYYRKSADKYMQLLECSDEKESSEEHVKIEKDQLQEKLKNINSRISELEELGREIEISGEKSLTDPDARRMKMNNGGRDVGYNVQIAADSKYHLVAAITVTNSASDQNQLHSISKKAKDFFDKTQIESNEISTENLLSNEEEKQLKVLADKGYYSAEEFKKCDESDIEAIVSPIARRSNSIYCTTDFKYDKERNLYICPNGEELKCVSRKTTKNKAYNNRAACERCPLKDKCVTAGTCREIKRSELDIYHEINAERYELNRELYTTRQMLVEHIFGTVKRSLGYTYFLMRGTEKVYAESCMHFFTYNLKRLVNIKGFKGTMEAIASI